MAARLVPFPIAALLAVALPGLAWAAQPPSDPRAGSPSEDVYGIPLDAARRDAAPGGRGGGVLRDARGGVGSSTIVPGTRSDPQTAEPRLSPKAGRSPTAAVVLLVLVVLAAAVSGAVAARTRSQPR